MARRSGTAPAAAPTIRDVARVARVSVTTASRVIVGGGAVREATRERVRAAVIELGYRPAIEPRSRRRLRRKVLGLSMLNVTPASSEWIRGVSRAAAEHGYTLAVCDGQNSKSTLAASLDRLLHEHVDGLLLGSAAPAAAQLERFRNAGVPIGIDVTRPEFSKMFFDEGWAPPTREAFRHLLGHGHRRIVICYKAERDENYVPSLHRYWIRLLEECLGEVGATLDRDLVFRFHDPGEVSPVMEQVFSPADPPTALVITAPDLAAPIVSSVMRLGVVVPDDVSVLTFEHWALTFRPRLASVAYDCFEQSYRIAKDVIARIEDLPGAGAMSRFPAAFDRRESIAPARVGPIPRAARRSA